MLSRPVQGSLEVIYLVKLPTPKMQPPSSKLPSVVVNQNGKVYFQTSFSMLHLLPNRLLTEQNQNTNAGDISCHKLLQSCFLYANRYKRFRCLAAVMVNYCIQRILTVLCQRQAVRQFSWIALRLLTSDLERLVEHIMTASILFFF